MNSYKLAIDGSSFKKPMRNILGMNNIPRISSANTKESDTRLFDALKLKHVRFHDPTVENSPMKIIDIHNIFPLFHLDESDPKNYFFEQTDDYLSQLQGKDINIDFRLGETIDHSGYRRLIDVPEDIDKWARICRNIIGHYKNGEMNGMYLNITHVTVWEEPDNNRLFAGTIEEYCEMFCKVYKLLKKDFPELEIGGPTMMHGNCRYLEDFIRNCQKYNITPDYISSTLYGSSPDDLVKNLYKFRDVTDSFGLKGIKHRLVEWNMELINWNTSLPRVYNHLYETVNTAFICEALTKFMDLDFLDVAYYYAWAVSIWSVMDFKKFEGVSLKPTYYGLLFFQRLAAECNERLEITYDADNKKITSLAGKTKDNKVRILVTCYDCEPTTIACNVKGAKRCLMHSIRDNYNETECLKPTYISRGTDTFTFVHEGKNGVYLLEAEY